VDSLENLPLVQIAYNIDKPFHRFTKRVFDLVFSGLPLDNGLSYFSIVFCKRKNGNRTVFLVGLSHVFGGRISLCLVHLSVDQRVENPRASLYFLGNQVSAV